MKIVIIILSLINGAFMLIDGIYVMLKGKYIGPAKPGPWALLFEKLSVNVFKLGPVFIIFGLLWMILVYGLITRADWLYYFAITISILTLWYLPVGSLISLVLLFCFIFKKNQLGL